MTFSSSLTAQAYLPVRIRMRRKRLRRFILVAAIVMTILAAAATWAHSQPGIQRFVERAWWHLDPRSSVSQLTATADYTTLDLHWDANADAKNYTVTVATDPALRHPVRRTTVASPGVAFVDMAQGTTYYYRVDWTSELGNDGVASRVGKATTAIHPVAAPAGLAVSATASTYTLTWAPVTWATQYVVRMSVEKDPAAFGASPADTVFPAITGTTFTTPAVSKAAGDAHYFTIEAQNGTLASADSGVVSRRLLLDPPASAAAVGASTSGVTVSWTPVAEASKYVIQRSSTADFATMDGSYTVPKAYARMAVNGLAPGTQYFFRVSAQSGTHAGQASPVVSASTTSTGSVGLRVATYNVLDPTLGKKTLGPWKERRKNVAKTIDDADADIVALQEAGWSKVQHGISPAVDLKHLVTKRMTLSKAGTRGDEILYSPSKYAAGPHGAFKLPRTTGDGVRVGIWQEFRDKASGARFIVVTTHLTAGIEHNAARERQAKVIIKKVHALDKSSLPIVLMGDLNSYDARATVTPMSLFAAAGLTDAELSTPATDTPDLNTWVKATSTTGAVRFDHIAVSSAVAVTRTAIEDPALPGPASDHRLLWADIAISKP